MEIVLALAAVLALLFIGYKSYKKNNGAVRSVEEAAIEPKKEVVAEVKAVEVAVAEVKKAAKTAAPKAKADPKKVAPKKLATVKEAAPVVKKPKIKIVK